MLAAGCANVVVPEATAEAMKYYSSGNILWLIGQAWGFIVPLLILFTGFSGKLSTFSARWGKVWFFTIALYLVLYGLITTALSLPLDYYSSFIRQHAYGLSTETLAKWFGDYGKSFLVGLAVAIAFVWVFYLLLKKSPRRWWFYSALVSTGFMFIMIVVQPIWIDPLFNNFGPMKNEKLEQKILNLASRAGIDNGRIFEVDKSSETKTLNAYVVGIGAAKRIVLWDTTIQQLNTDELLFVMGHEMGHYVLHHMWWGLGYFTALSFAVFFLTYLSANYLMKRYKWRFGFAHLYNIGSIPLLLVLTSFYMLLFSPLTNCFSRHLEHQADIFGLEITQNNKAAGMAFLILQKENLANPRPGPIFNMWRGSHPPLGERIDFCNNYCPWEDGEPLKYGKYFKEDQ